MSKLLVVAEAMRNATLRAGLVKHLAWRRSGSESFSQFGEDLVVSKIFEGIELSYRDSYFIDVGAFHPTWISNTYAHYRRGMVGVNADTSIEKIRLFEAFRPKDVSLVRAIVPEGGPAEVTLASPPGYSEAASVLEGNEAPTAKDPHFAGRGLAMVRVPTATVSELVKRAPPGRTLAYLNIDCEGLDEAILGSIDFSSIRPHVVSVESHLPPRGRLRALGETRTYGLLEGQGYTWLAHCGLTSIYLDARLLERYPKIWV